MTGDSKMNEVEALQKLAEILNKEGGKHHPYNNKWVVSGNSIQLVGMDENSTSPRGVDIDTFHKIEKALILSGMDSANLTKQQDKKGWPKDFEVSKSTSDTEHAENIIAKISFRPGHANPSIEDIEKIGAAYGKHMEELFDGEQKAVQKIVDTLNKAKIYTYKWEANKFGSNKWLIVLTENDPKRNWENNTDGSKVQGIETALEEAGVYKDKYTPKYYSENLRVSKDEYGRLYITLHNDYVPSDETIAKIGMDYYKYLKNKGYTNKRSNAASRLRGIAKTIKDFRSFDSGY